MPEALVIPCIYNQLEKGNLNILYADDTAIVYADKDQYKLEQYIKKRHGDILKLAI